MRVLIIFFMCINVWGHGGAKHSQTQPKDLDVDRDLQKKYVQINKEYLKKVKPIFKSSCFDCHGNTTTYPWYYKLPGVKQLIDHDINEAKEHLDFSNDFPFKGHQTPIKDMEAISKVIKQDSMPPFRYWIMHTHSRLSMDEKQKVQKWIKYSKEILK